MKWSGNNLSKKSSTIKGKHVTNDILYFTFATCVSRPCRPPSVQNISCLSQLLSSKFLRDVSTSGNAGTSKKNVKNLTHLD